MSSRSSSGPGRDPLVQLPAIDLERVVTAVVGAGVVLAIGAVLLGGFVPSVRALTVLLYPLAVLFPALGIVIAAATGWWLWTRDRSSESPLLEGVPPEDGVSHTETAVGRETERTITDAAQGRYRCRANESATDVRRRLTKGAVRVVVTKRGLATDAAREAVRSGTWTDDPVAAAFLADGRRQPLGEWLRAAVDPGAAYQRRVRRTLAAIETIGGDARTDAEVDR
ncbi:hypothetical protein [Natrinema versiforme]|uniref:Uncharacterized protein n=1 Tax=Natrinema versiforme TaxID=88724 RepID=A0A4P8WJT2_9EURY|nr:hypothetical protein [Natrinema versiforme]QCS43757.1 hypothetical protein FEJ81_15875 [Natrinema versiforme]